MYGIFAIVFSPYGYPPEKYYRTWSPYLKFIDDLIADSKGGMEIWRKAS